jgi:hypothetical protein
LSIIQKPILLQDHRMFPAFLSYDRDSYFLLDNSFLPEPFGNYGRYYQENPATLVVYPMEEVLDGFYTKNAPKLIHKLFHLIAKNHPNASEFFLSFPLWIQRSMCELTILSQFRFPSKVQIEFLEWFKYNFKTDVWQFNHLVEHYFVENKKQTKRVLNLKDLEKGWVDKKV